MNQMFNELYNLYHISDEAFMLYYQLEHYRKHPGGNVILYICPSRQYKYLCFRRVCDILETRIKNCKNPIYGDYEGLYMIVDHERLEIRLKTSDTNMDIYIFKATEEIDKGIDGIRLKEVRFYE